MKTYIINYGPVELEPLTGENGEVLTFGDFYDAVQHVNDLIESELATQGIGEDHPQFESHVSGYWTDYFIATLEAA